MYASVFIVSLLIFIGVAIGNNENQAKLRYYHNSIDNYTEWSIDEASNILSTSWYDSSRTTVIFTHGFTGHPKGPAVTGVINAYLEQGESNVALLNWQQLASNALPGLVNSYINWAIPNAMKLGADFAAILLKLSEAGLDLNKTHLVGHSLGAHVFGITGNKLSEKGVQLPWITGLDPATGFDMKPAFLRLQPGSAGFVAVVHSDPNKYGSKKDLGFVDFWPNFRVFGQVTQPGCPGGPQSRFSEEDLCNHNRAWQLLVDALKHPGTQLGSYAKHFRMWKNYTKEERKAAVLEIGKYDAKALPGSYFLVTAAESPYGLGENGL